MIHVEQTLVLPNINDPIIYGNCEGYCKIGDILFIENDNGKTFSITKFPLIRNSWDVGENHIFICIKPLSKLLIGELREQVKTEYQISSGSKKRNHFILDQINRKLAVSLRGKTLQMI